MELEAVEFVVVQIDGDYAHLRRKEEPNGEAILVARALLPEEIREGSRLMREFLMYILIER
mgnify:CR=1 FL=1